MIYKNFCEYFAYMYIILLRYIYFVEKIWLEEITESKITTMF